MPGENCSIPGCGVCRRPKFKGISLFKCPEEGDAKDTEQRKWREEFLGVIKTTRTPDADFCRQVKSGSIHVCQLHFNEDDYIVRKYNSIINCTNFLF